MSKTTKRDETSTVWNADELIAFATGVFKELNLPEADAAIVAENLVVADLRGVYSHGVMRIPIYAERLRRGLFNARPHIKVERVGDSAVHVDGDNGMGAVVGVRAMDEAMARAAETGIAMASVCRSNHFGMCSYFLRRPLARGFVAMSCTNAPPTTAPFGGRSPFIGTNPLAFAAPVGGHRPLVLDMSSSIVARGKIISAAQRGQTIPEGWAVDKDGRPTTDSAEALEGAVLTVGGPKGSGLAVFVELLAGVLSGANLMRQLPDFYRNLTDVPNIGHFFLAIDITHFMPLEQFKDRADAMIAMVKECPTADGHEEILLPGEPEERLEEARRRDGIPLPAEVVGSLQEVGDGLGVAVPNPIS